jgi:hypothetical protein
VSDFVIDNLRLAELVAIVRQNESFFDAFVEFLAANGYKDVHAFIHEADEGKALGLIESYLGSTGSPPLYDGMAVHTHQTWRDGISWLGL